MYYFSMKITFAILPTPPYCSKLEINIGFELSAFEYPSSCLRRPWRSP
jgi:hypothetical protein